MQPNIKVFLKTFLELEKRNMVQVLSFDSKSTISLLDEKHSDLIVKEFPIIYKVGVPGECKKVLLPGETINKHSAIDIALENNQVGALKVMIKYIINN